jgi:O-antigen/teichoic acid export membrane protein
VHVCAGRAMKIPNPELEFTPEVRISSVPSLPANESLRGAILSGSMTLLIGSALVSCINLVYNILIARSLGAAGFGHAVSIYTLLMLLSAVTLSFQFVCSKFVAKNTSLIAKASVYHVLHRRSWQAGAVVGATLAASSKLIAHYLNLPDPWLVTLLAVGTAFYIPLGVRRGLLQGMYQFRTLSVNFILEVLVKLGATLALLASNLGVRGVIIAVAASVIVAYFAAVPPINFAAVREEDLPASFLEGVQAIVFFIGQVVINNIDILLVKHFFPAAEAGMYAAIAVVGRVVYMASWAVISSMFPLTAGAQRVEPHRRTIIITPLLLILLITGVSCLGLWMLPQMAWKALFGATFLLGANKGLPLLYVVATGTYCVSVVLIAYEMSRKIGNTGWLQLLFSGGIALGIYAFHSTLHQVVMVQLVLMAIMLLCVAVPFFRVSPEFSLDPEGVAPEAGGAVVKVRRASEAEVLAEFLKNEFYQPEFNEYWHRLEKVVFYPDLNDDRENAIRRALLFRRRGRMWRELPRDTEWWEVRLEPADLTRVRVFPRSQWRGVANGDFALKRIAQRIRMGAVSPLKNRFLAKLRSVSGHLRQEETPHSSILLIGLNESSPLTIIEGNHRMVAATMVSPFIVGERFRFFCGFSPRMTECCWYKTDMATLWHYAKNSVKYIARDRKLVMQPLQDSAE